MALLIPSVSWLGLSFKAIKKRGSSIQINALFLNDSRISTSIVKNYDKVCIFQFPLYIFLKQCFTDEIDKLGALGVIFVSRDIEFDAI